MDEKEELELALMDANKVDETVKTEGWTKVIKPALETRKAASIVAFGEAVTYEEFVRIQQSINAFDGLINFIEDKLTEGKNALKELRNG